MKSNTIIIILSIALVLTILLLIQKHIKDISNKIDDDNFKRKAIQSLVRQASRWAVASRQDNNAIVQLLHANYGAGYLWALKDIASDTDIEKITKIEVSKFKDEIIKAQDSATKNVAGKCPDIAPPSSYLTQLSEEG